MLDFRYLKATLADGFIPSGVTFIGKSVLDGKDLYDIWSRWLAACWSAGWLEH